LLKKQEVVGLLHGVLSVTEQAAADTINHISISTREKPIDKAQETRVMAYQYSRIASFDTFHNNFSGLFRCCVTKQQVYGV